MPLFNPGVQAGPNSCGAYALTSALCSLDANAVNYLQTIQINKMDTNNVAAGYGTPLPGNSVANRVYQCTGVLQLNLQSAPPQARYDYGGQPNTTPLGRNPPSALLSVVRAAILAGHPFQADLNLTQNAQVFWQTVVVQPNQDLYQVEDLLLQNMGFPPHIVPAYNPAAVDTVQLVVVANGDHWITVDPAVLYDPAAGTVQPYTVANGDFTITQTQKRYMCAGMWIDLHW